MPVKQGAALLKVWNPLLKLKVQVVAIPRISSYFCCPFVPFSFRLPSASTSSSPIWSRSVLEPRIEFPRELEGVSWRDFLLISSPMSSSGTMSSKVLRTSSLSEVSLLSETRGFSPRFCRIPGTMVSSSGRAREKEKKRIEKTLFQPSHIFFNLPGEYFSSSADISSAKTTCSFLRLSARLNRGLLLLLAEIATASHSISSSMPEKKEKR